MRRLREAPGTCITLVTLLIIVLLAVPVCLLTGMIGAVWSAGDRLLSKLTG